jgi:hypothetical protein
VAGTGESFTVTDLAGSDTLHFAIRAADEVPNWSPWSNVVSGQLDGVAPDAVTDLAVAFAADTSITLCWTATGDNGHAGQASQYDLRYATNPSWTWEEMTRVADLPRPRTAAQRDTFTVNYVNPGTTYYFLLKVGDEITNWSGASNKVGMDPAVPPAQVTDLGVARTTPTSLVLQWTATGDDGFRGMATQYILRLTTTAGAAWDEMTAVTGTTLPRPSGQTDSMEVMDLDPDSDYYFRLEVVDDVSLRSAPSNLAHGTTQDVVPPAAVTDLRVVGTTGNVVTVQWTKRGDNGNEGRPAEEALRYSLSPITESNWLQASYVGGWLHIGYPGDTITVEVEGLEQERTYFFAEKTADEVPNWSALSNVVSATTPDQTPPATVSDLVAGLPTATSIKLTWTSPGDDGRTGTATSYEIRYTTAPITISTWSSATPVPSAPAPSVGGSIQNITVEGLLQGTIYYFALKAKDEQGNESGLSNVVSSSTLDLIPPEAIVDLTAVSATSSSVSLRWTAPGDDGPTGRAAVYDVRYSATAINEVNWSSASQAGGEPLPRTHGTVENSMVSGLQEGTLYYFAIRAADDAENWSPLSNVVLATTPDQTPPATVSDLVAGLPTATSIKLTWTSPGDDGRTGTATSYDIRYASTPISISTWGSATPVPSAPAPSFGGTIQSFTVENLSQGTVYYFALKAQDDAGNISGLSNVATSSTLDRTAPGAVTNLTGISSTANSVSVRWTAPGDDGFSGQAASYDLRYSITPITENNWPTGIPASGEPLPNIAGTVQNFTVHGLQPGTTYYIALKTSDDAENVSPLSNVTIVTTLSAPPGPDRYALVTGFLSGNVVRFDLSTGTAEPMIALQPSSGGDTGDRPRGIAVDTQQRIYVALRGGTQNVKRFTWEGTPLGDFTQSIGGYGPGQIAFSSAGELIVGGDASLSSSIFRYSGDTGLLLGTFRLDGFANVVGLLVDGTTVYSAAYFTGKIARYRLADLPVIGASLVTGAGLIDHAIGMTVGHDGNLFVASGGQRAVQEFNITTGAFIGTFLHLGLSPVDVKYDPYGRRYYVTDGGNSVLEYDESATLIRTLQSNLLNNTYSVAIVVTEQAKTMMPPR